jgi:hypothetical protein
MASSVQVGPLSLLRPATDQTMVTAAQRERTIRVAIIGGGISESGTTMRRQNAGLTSCDRWCCPGHSSQGAPREECSHHRKLRGARVPTHNADSPLL